MLLNQLHQATIELDEHERYIDNRKEFTRPTREFITKYGLNEAIVLEELAFRQQITDKSQKTNSNIGAVGFLPSVKAQKGKRTFFTPIRSKQPDKYKMPTLESCFPWLTQPGIRKINLKLKREKLIEISCTARSRMVHTKSYFVPWEVVQRVKSGSRLKLSKKDCVAYGPAAALILNHVQYNLQRRGTVWIDLSPDKLQHLTPLSESTIRRAQGKLVVFGELIKDGSTIWYKLGKPNPLAGKVLGMAPRRVVYYNDVEATGFKFWAAREHKLAYSDHDVPELESLAKEVAIAFTDETAKELADIKPDERHYFNEAAYICWKNDFDPADYVAAQFKSEDNTKVTWPRPWMPELLISDDAEQRFVDSGHSEGCFGLSS